MGLRYYYNAGEIDRLTAELLEEENDLFIEADEDLPVQPPPFLRYQTDALNSRQRKRRTFPPHHTDALNIRQRRQQQNWSPLAKGHQYYDAAQKYREK